MPACPKRRWIILGVFQHLRGFEYIHKLRTMGCLQIRSSAAFALVTTMLLLLGCEDAQGPTASSISPSHRALQPQRQMWRLLNNSVGGGRYSKKRVTTEEDCSPDEVAVYQNNVPHLSSGIPAYNVEIINSCISCTVYNVHVSCRDFASTDLVNPALFRLIGFDDCLVKDGGAIGPGGTVSFEYSNSFAYPLNVAFVSCITT